jgi:ribosomal protein L7/L12
MHLLEEKMLQKSDSGASRDKRKKFVELAEKRTRNAIKSIRIIGKLGNKNAYEYTPEDVKKIASALNKEIEAMKARMSHSGSKDTVDFEL